MVRKQHTRHEQNHQYYYDKFLLKKDTNFTGLNLNHYGESNNSYLSQYHVIKSNSASYIKINLKNTNISTHVITTHDNTTCSASGISFYKWVGSLYDCNINIKDTNIYYSKGICGKYGKFNITNSQITSHGSTIYIEGSWEGNIKNSTIISTDSSGIYSEEWKGKIYKTKIIAKGEYYNFSYRSYWISGAVNLGLSKGTIKNCIIKASNSLAVKATNNVKIINSSLSSKKGFPKIYRYKPDLRIREVKPIYFYADYPFWHIPPNKYDYYYVTVQNDGYTASKSCYLSFKTMKTYKKYYVKPLKPKQKAIIKIKFLSKYMTQDMNILYPKTFKIDCNNQIKECTKEDNVYKLDKYTYKSI